MRRFRRMKLFPKTFCYLLALFGVMILIMQLLLYFFLPRVYLDKVHRELDRNLDSLCGQVAAANWTDCDALFTQYTSANSVNLTVYSGQNRKIYQGMPLQIELFQKEELNNDQFRVSGIPGMEAILLKNRTVTSMDGRLIHLELSASTRPEYEAVKAILYLLPLVSLIMTAAAVVCAYFYSRKLTRPINGMLRAARHMEALESDAAVPVESSDELGLLAEEINRLYQRLRQTIRSLEQEKEHIAEVERSKVDFLRSASHELKTPLAGLRILMENMRYNVGKYKDHDTYLGSGIELVDQLTAMIRDILDASRLQGEGGAVQTIRVSKEIAAVWQEYELLAKAKGLTAEITLCPEATAEMDPALFRRVCSNLLSNAVRYTPSGGSIRIFGDADTVSVQNTCTPLTDEQCRRVFNAFYRPDFARSGTDGGSGLGLYLVKEILESYSLSYLFTPDQNGMRFTFRLHP